MKGVHYAAGVTKVYREAIDLLNDEARYKANLARWHEELAVYGARGYTTGLLFGTDADLYNFSGRSSEQEAELCGSIIEIKGKVAKVRLRTKLAIGDFVEYITPGLECQCFAIEEMKSEDGLDTVSAPANEIVLIPAIGGVRKDDLLRKSSRFKK
jgi:putative protease